MYVEKVVENSVVSQSIDAVWHFEYQSDSDVDSLVFPDASVDIIFKKSQGHMEVLLCGVMNKTMKLRHREGDTYYGIRFKPGYAWAYLNKSIDTTLNQTFPLHHFFKKQESVVEYMNHDSPDLYCFEQLVQELLLRKVDTSKLKILDTQYHILASVEGGDVSMAATLSHLSRRHFSRCFRTMYGISPREYANIKRLNTLRSLPKRFKAIPLTELALLLGYCDQSHMNHGIKKLCGLTPKQLMSQSYNT